MVCSHDRGATMPEFLPSFCPYQNPDTHRSVVPLWNTRQSQLPCKTLERCPSAVRLHLYASLPRASTTSRGRRSTNDGRGTRPPTHGMSEHSSFDEGSRATRGFAGNAFSHRLDVSSRRVRAVRALGRTAPRDARRGFSTSPGFLAEGPARCARVTGGVCDAARHHDALSDSTDVHGRPGTRVVTVAMPRSVHHARQTATRRRSRVFRVSPV